MLSIKRFQSIPIPRASPTYIKIFVFRIRGISLSIYRICCYFYDQKKFKQVGKRTRIERIEMPHLFNTFSIVLAQRIAKYYYYASYVTSCSVWPVLLCGGNLKSSFYIQPTASIAAIAAKLFPCTQTSSSLISYCQIKEVTSHL